MNRIVGSIQLFLNVLRYPWIFGFFAACVVIAFDQHRTLLTLVPFVGSLLYEFLIRIFTHLWTKNPIGDSANYRPIELDPLTFPLSVVLGFVASALAEVALFARETFILQNKTTAQYLDLSFLLNEFANNLLFCISSLVWVFFGCTILYLTMGSAIGDIFIPTQRR